MNVFSVLAVIAILVMGVVFLVFLHYIGVGLHSIAYEIKRAVNYEYTGRPYNPQ